MKSTAAIVPLAFALAVAVAACTQNAASGGASTPTPTGTVTPTPGSGCTAMPARCTAWNVLESCGADGVTWTQTTCADGCYAGACSPTACADECALGETGANGTCKLWSVASQSFVTADPVSSTHDRALDDDARVFTENLPFGQVANTHYADSTLATVTDHADLGDSSLWTGSLLAAEAWRYRTSGAPEAEARMEALVAALHRDFQVTGDVGYFARFAAPAGSAAVGELEASCGLTDHCGVPFDGASWSWLGHTSRDQYTGVMLGLWQAYEATPDAALKDTIRGDVVAVAKELATVRTGVPVHVVLAGVPIDTTMNLENVILAPNETADGRIWVVLDVTTPSNSDLYGAREFLPDLSTALTQIPGFSFLPPIKRQSSSIMLGAFLRMAMRMAADSPASAADLQFIQSYYEAHVDSWIADAQTWSYSDNCGNGYYANHIAYISAYAWSMLETDPSRQQAIRTGVLTNRMWAALGSHKNSYFAFLWGGVESLGATDATMSAAAAQLAQYPAGPRVNVPVNHVADYPNSTSCSANGQPESTVATDVRDRVPDEFIWERGPWVLFSGGDTAQTYSNTDYLAAYWSGRFATAMPDDHAGTCARWGN